MIICKSETELKLMDDANRIVRAVLSTLERAVEPGVTTLDLDRLAESETRKHGATPAFLGYRGYPASICISINDEVVHGIPSGKKSISAGDLVSLDFGVLYKGYYGDSAVTVPVGVVDDESRRLLEATRMSLEAGVREAVAGAHLSNISSAVQRTVEEAGFSVVRDFVGHGIGTALHEDPPVPNFGDPGHGPRLREGMTLAIEPMVTAGGWRVKVGADQWTVTTTDGSRAAHFEYSVAVTGDGPWILGGTNDTPRKEA